LKNILVTGGAGFIGTNFVYYLHSRPYRITVLDKLTYAGGRDNLEPLRDVKLIVGDICDAGVVRDALSGIDIVVHFAAESHNTRSETDPDLFYRTNVEGTKVMLEESFRAGVEKFIHISTDEVYGSIESGYFKESDKLRGDEQATSAYSKSKSLADDIAMDFGRNYPVIVLRPTNNFGPWQYPEKALPRWITNLLIGKKIPLWGKGLQIRDWLFAPVTSECIEFLIHKGENGNAYNLAANHDPEITNRQAAEWLCTILDLDPTEYIEFVPDPRPNHDFRYALDTSKINALGFKSSFDVYEQFVSTVNWYRTNPEWWGKRKPEAESIYKN
jgi:dTDP-glucose 4,6-dehydratase